MDWAKNYYGRGSAYNYNYKNKNEMAINATKVGRELLTPGGYMARCQKIVHIGTREYESNGSLFQVNEAVLYFELVTAEKPTVLEMIVQLSTNKESDFRKMLNNWRGKDMTDEEAEAFNITVSLIKPCTINVIHKTLPTKAGGSFTKEEIMSVGQIMMDVKCPAGKMPTQVLEYDNWDAEIFEGLTAYIKNKVKASKEYKGMFNND
jgi:hypothetical protein